MEHLPEDDRDGLFGFGLPDEETRDLVRRISPLLLQALKGLAIAVSTDATRHIAIKAGYRQIMMFIVDPLLVEHLDRFESIIQDNIPAGISFEIVCEETTLRKGGS
ncbi:MAG: hypothetical protein ABIQ35_12830 [Verrucomicrobiota bacterium]